MCIDVDDTIGPEDKIPLVVRHGFLRGVAATAAVAPVGGPAALATPALAAEGRKKAKDSVPLDQISIQLFMLRDQLAIDFEGTIAALHAIGYTRVEHAGFVGRTVAAFKADPGQGLLDFVRIFQHSKKAGAIEYIVERDDAGSPPRQPADALTTAEVGYDFLTAIRF